MEGDLSTDAKYFLLVDDTSTLKNVIKNIIKTKTIMYVVGTYKRANSHRPNVAKV